MCEMLQSLIDEGIAACVAAFKMAGVSFEKTFETITSTDTYKDAAREQIFEYYHQ